MRLPADSARLSAFAGLRGVGGAGSKGEESSGGVGLGRSLRHAASIQERCGWVPLHHHHHSCNLSQHCMVSRRLAHSDVLASLAGELAAQTCAHASATQ